MNNSFKKSGRNPDQDKKQNPNKTKKTLREEKTNLSKEKTPPPTGRFYHTPKRGGGRPHADSV